MTRFRAPLLAALAAASLAIAAPAAALSVSARADDPPSSSSPSAVTPGSGPVSVAVIVPLTVPPGTTGLIDSATLAAYTAPDGLLTAQLDAVAGTAAAIGLDPMIPASIRVLGSTAPPEALDWLDRLASVPNETFLLAYADADPAVAAAAGALDLLTPSSFDQVIDPANFGPAVTAPPTAEPQPGSTDGVEPTPDPTPTEPTDAGPPPLPTLDDLLAWPTTLPTIAWPADTTVTAEAAAALADAGYDDVIVTDDNVTAVQQALVDLDGVVGVVQHAEVTEALRDATTAVTDLGLQGSLSELGNVIDATAAAAPGRTLVATLDRYSEGDTWRIDEVLASLDLRASAQVVTLSEVLEGPIADADLVAPAIDTHLARIAQLVAAERAEVAFSTVADVPLDLTAPRRLELLALLGVGWTAVELDWDTPATAFLTRSQQIRAGVQVADSTDLFLAGDSANLPLAVTNALPVPVTVYVTVVPDRPLLSVRETHVEVSVAPDSSSPVPVPVQSIANGDVNVRVTLTSADGATVGSPRFVKVILQAGWETAGTAIFVALVALMFGGGLVRSILKRRKAGSAGDAAGETAGD
jgi:hypothetical protein